ncbi:MAG TPA: T9SS type A sorting domain-containing protein [Bacteroidota bacterium]|nr:T9SS type A sorting domain-containing protein [Bacteroidota bacterium]
MVITTGTSFFLCLFARYLATAEKWMLKRLKYILFFLLPCLFLVHATSTSQVYGWRKRLAAVGMTVGINPLNPNTVYAERSPGLLAVSFDKGRTWPLGMSPGLGQIRQILVHPSDTMTIFCASGSDVPGLVKSTDGGQSWRTVLPHYHIDGESVTYDPQHPDTMYAGQFASGKVYKSTDRGETWTYQGTANDLLCAFTVRPDSANILFAGTGGGSISKSTDYGFTWRVVKPSLSASEVPKICVSDANPLVAYATLNGGGDFGVGVWKTTNGGETWIKTNAPNRSLWGMDIEHGDGNVVYAGTFDGNSPTVYKTTDGGATWSEFVPGLPALSDLWSLKVHPSEPGMLWVAATVGAFGSNGIFAYSATSTAITGYVLDSATHDTVRNGYVAVTETSDSVNLAASGGAYTLRYFDADPSLSPTVHTRAYPYYRSDEQGTFIHDSILSRDIYLTQLARATISGMIKDSALQQARQADVSIYQSTYIGNVVYSGRTDLNGYFQFDSLYISQYPEVQYDKVVVDPEFPFASATIRPLTLDTAGLSLEIDLTNADLLIVSSTDSTKYAPYYQVALESIGVTFNTWNSLSQGSPPLPRVQELKKKTIIYYTGDSHAALPPAEHDSLVACLELGGNLFLTGQDIAEMNDSSDLMKNRLRIGFGANSSYSFVTGLSGGLFYRIDFPTGSSTGANNQTSRDTLVPLDPRVKREMGYGSGIRGTAAVRIDSVGSGGKAIVMGFGFEAIGEATSRQSVMQKIIGFFDGSIVVGVNGDEIPSPPASFMLHQNYPNPFNPKTNIQFHLHERGLVRLKVFDVLGKEVTTLLSEKLSEGSYSTAWDATGMPSGVYYCRLHLTPDAGVRTPALQTKMMIVVK